MSKFFTKNNVNIPSIGLGTWDVRGKEGEKTIQLALDLGYRHIDTAQMYENEKEVGNAISDSKIKREEIFITTKIYTLIVKNDGIEDSFENSLINLKTDHVDLLLIHFPAFTTNLNDMLDILFKLKETGKTKNVGISNFNHNLVNECIKLGYKDIFCNQVEYHPYLEQNNLIRVLKEYNIIPVAYSPLAKGKLLNDKVILNISKKYTKQPAQIILRWLNQQGWISIPKSANEDRMKENMNIFDFTISEKDMNLLHGLARNYRAVPCALGTSHQIDLPSRHGVNGLELI
jgi:diketogulonate reductase-like aldo/keto reductase